MPTFLRPSRCPGLMFSCSRVLCAARPSSLSITHLLLLPRDCLFVFVCLFLSLSTHALTHYLTVSLSLTITHTHIPTPTHPPTHIPSLTPPPSNPAKHTLMNHRFAYFYLNRSANVFRSRKRLSQELFFLFIFLFIRLLCHCVTLSSSCKLRTFSLHSLLFFILFIYSLLISLLFVFIFP